MGRGVAPAWLLVGLGALAGPGCSAGQRLLELPYWEPAGEAAVRLAEQDADLGLTDDFGRTALHLASAWGDFEAAHAFVEHGARLEARDRSGRTPLFAAVDETARRPRGWLAPDYSPDREGQLRIIRLLVEHGADLEAVDSNGYTPLRWAAGCESYHKLDLLSELGANLEAADRDGNTALHDLAREAAPDTVRLLVERGANVNARNAWGATPLHVAAQRSLFAEEVYRVMCEHGADPEARDEQGRSPAELLERNPR